MILLTLAFALASAGLAQADDPLAPAREGQVQCIGFNAANRTCTGMSRYSFEADGTIRTRSDILVAPQPFVVLSIEGVATVRGAAVCEPIRAMDDARITVDGQPADDTIAQAVRSQINASIGAMIGQEGCSVLVPRGDGWIIPETTLEGQRRPDLDQPFVWVSPSDGYRLGI